MKISEAFFDDVRGDFMSFSPLASAFIGDILESTIFMNELFKILATKYASSGFSNFDIFSWAELNPRGPKRGDFNELIGGQDVLVDVFKILDNGITPESGGPQNARLYDLLVAVFPDLVISFHAKYNRNPKDLRIQDLAADELSTILVDLLLHIRESLDWESSTSSVPIRKHTSYNIQVLASNKFEASNIFSTKLKMNSMLDLQHTRGSRKSILSALYKNRVAELINSRLRLSPATNLEDAIDKVQDLFDDWYSPDSEESEIRDELYALAEDTFIGKPLTMTYVETIIKYFSDEENLKKMFLFTSSSTFELNKYETLDFLFDSGEKLKFENIPQNLFTYSNGKKVALTKNRFNRLVNEKKRALIIVRDINTGELGAVGLDLINNLPGNVREGYAYFDATTNKEVVINNIYLNNPEGNRLISKVAFNEYGFSLRSGGDEWFRPYMNIQSINGMFQLNYYRALGWATGNRFIAFLQQAQDNIMTVAPYQSLITVDKLRSSPRWLKDLRFQKEEDSFLDPDFPTHVNRDFILENSEQFLDKLSLLTDLYVGTSKTSKYLPIDNYEVQVLGAYKDENSRLILGPGYDDLELSFRTLLVHYLVQFGDTIEANDFALKLCSLKKSRGTSIDINNIAFNYDQTRKQWLQNWIDVFRTYQFTDSNSPLIKKMNEIIVGRENKFYGISNEFDLNRHNKNFDKREILLAKRVVSVLTEIFGNLMFEEMFSGGVIVKDGTVQFISHSWDVTYKIGKKINVKFSKGYIIGANSPTYLRHRYILDKFTSSYDIELPTDSTLDVLDATISILEVPVKFVLPIYKKPVDKSLLLDFYKTISSETYKHFEALNHFKREALERSWRSQFYKTLMKICRDRGYDSLQLSLADDGFRAKIFRDGKDHQDFKNNAFDWLTSRGEGWVTLTHSRGELKLSPDDFRRYFKDDWAKFASSLYKPVLVRHLLINQIESDLRYMQDFIMDTIDFIFHLAESATNKKIILYPHIASKTGFTATPKYSSYFPPKDVNLNEWFLHAGSPKQIGFTLDLNDLNSVYKFVEMIPILLGNLLVRPAAFIVRDPDYPSLTNDQCMFAFGMPGSLLPSQMVGGNQGPPSTGMRWTGGSEANYKRSNFYLGWNKILSKHNILGIHKFTDPNKFYEVVNRILFASV